MIQILIKHLRLDKYFSSWLILLIDTVISTLATGVAYSLVSYLLPSPLLTLRFGLQLLLASGVCSIVSFYALRTFRSVIRHSTLREMWKIGAAVLCKIALMCLLVAAAAPVFPSAVLLTGLLLDTLLTLFLLIAIRILMIVAYDIIRIKYMRHNNCKRVLIFGTDEKQIALMIRLQNSVHYKVIGFLTYGRTLRSHTIAELPVYFFEQRDNVSYLIETIDLDAVLFASYDSAQQEQERLLKYCAEAGIKVLIAPPIDEVIDGKLMKQPIREIRIEDLLGRPEIEISLADIRADFCGKTIMVTGAAGSIGSELCRQVAAFDIQRLVLFDNSETPVHNIRLELEERFPDLKFIPVIGDIRMTSRLDFAFRTYRPQIVFHAAAYKHVPLMEENPCEAVVVNVAGTRNVADLCLRYGIEKMVMISTDKAVNPTNVMGASKRLAEIYVQSLGQAIAAGRMEGHTKFVTTRFGNVLGSNGSVIPRFRQQIEKGGPVTVTHPDITRFFMTIPEACRLVMEAATMSGGNEIFVFDMGKSVRIADLAYRMIELAGFRVGTDIKIEYTGLRPGEKLYEEVLSNSENTLPTSHEKIRVAKVREYDYDDARQVVDRLERLAREVDVPATVRLMKRTIPEFKSKNSRFEALDRENETPDEPRYGAVGSL